MKKYINVSLIRDILLIVFVVLGILRNTTIAISHFDTICKFVQIASLGLLLGLSIIDFFKKRIKLDIFVIILGAYSLVNTIITKHTFFLGFFIFFLAFASVRYKKTVFKLNVAIILTTVFVIMLALVGVIENQTTTRGTEDLRYLLGFTTSTLPMSICFFTLVNFIIIYRDKLKWPFFLIYIVSSLILYKLTDTRTGFILILISSFTYLVLQNVKVFRVFDKFINYKAVKIIVYLIPFMIFLLEIVLVIIFYQQNDLSFKLNNLLSTRLSNTKYLIDNYGFSIFGKKLPTTLEDGFYIGADMCYFNYLLNHGIIALVITIYLQLRVTNRAFKNKDYVLLFSLILIMVDGFAEPYLLDYKYQFVTFILAGSLAKDKKMNLSFLPYKLEAEQLF